MIKKTFSRTGAKAQRKARQELKHSLPLRSSFAPLRLCVKFFLLLSLLAPAAFSQQKPLPLARIEVEGAKRYSREQIVEASGLKPGQSVNESVLDEAAGKLLRTGFFTNLSYRVRSTGGQATVTFVVEEKADKGAPVIFDNFVWFSDAELTEAIRREIPSYDGTALEVGNTTDKIRDILGRLLRERKIRGEVEYMPLADASGTNPAHVFTVKGIRIPICEVSFTGTSGISESELKDNSKSLFNEEYTHRYVLDFANSPLRELYRQRGYLRARFHEAPVKLLDGSACTGGVAVTLVAEEGVQYLWDKAEWSENKVLTAQELDAALGMKAGEVASSTKIEKGLVTIDKAYGRKGYLRAYLRPQPQYDDANRRVTFSFTAVEGPQYRMGNLSFTGLSEAVATHLKSKWQLATGEVYDASYIDTYFNVMGNDRELIQSFAGKSPKVSAEVKPDKNSLTVQVTIKFN
jgi:outer membrane protein assembly factor BamA